MKIVNSSIIDTEVIAQLKSHVFDVIGCCQEVHRELGPWLNEYIYQEALKMALEEKKVPFVKEYYFQVSYHGQPLSHKHYMDFLCKGNIALEYCIISLPSRINVRSIIMMRRPKPFLFFSEARFFHLDG